MTESAGADARSDYRLFFQDPAFRQYVFEEAQRVGVDKRLAATIGIVFGFGMSIGVTSVASTELIRQGNFSQLALVAAFFMFGTWFGPLVTMQNAVYLNFAEKNKLSSGSRWVDYGAIGGSCAVAFATLGIGLMDLLGFLHNTAHLRNIMAGLIGGCTSLCIWRLLLWLTVDDSRKSVLDVVASTGDQSIVLRNDSDFQIKWLLFWEDDLLAFVPMGGIAGAGAIFTDPGQESVIHPPVDNDLDQYLVKVYSGWERQSGQFIVSRGAVYSFNCVDRVLVSRSLAEGKERDIIRFRNRSSKNVLICLFALNSSDAAPRVPYLVARFCSRVLATAWVDKGDTHSFDLSGTEHKSVVLRVATHFG